MKKWLFISLLLLLTTPTLAQYSRSWSESTPADSDPANTLGQAIRNFRTDIRQRISCTLADFNNGQLCAQSQVATDTSFKFYPPVGVTTGYSVAIYDSAGLIKNYFDKNGVFNTYQFFLYGSSSGKLTVTVPASFTDATLTLPAGGTILTSTSTIDLSTQVINNLSINNLNSGTGASSSTFWRGDGTWAAPTGTVSSVGLSLPAIFTVSNSPVTGSGTLTAVLANETANYFFAGPTSGGAAAPTFRAMVAADVPAGIIGSTQLDAAHKTGTASLTLLDPVAGDTGRVSFEEGKAITITRVYCAVKAATNVVIGIETGSETSPFAASKTQVLSGDLTCTTTGASTTSFANASVSTRIPIDLKITSVSGTPDTLAVFVEFTY